MKRKPDVVCLDVTLPPNLNAVIYASWKHNPQGYDTFDGYREAYCLSASSDRIFAESPKQIVAGTDGSIRLETL